MTLKVELTEKEKEQLARAKELGAKDMKLVSDFVDDNTEEVIGIGCAVAATAIITAVVVTLINKKRNSEKAKIRKAAKAQAKMIAKAKKAQKKAAKAQVEAFLDGEDVAQEDILTDDTNVEAGKEA